MEMVEEVLKDATMIPRTLTRRKQTKEVEADCKIRWITMAKSNTEKEIEYFVKTMNTALEHHKIQF